MPTQIWNKLLKILKKYPSGRRFEKKLFKENYNKTRTMK